MHGTASFPFQILSPKVRKVEQILIHAKFHLFLQQIRANNESAALSHKQCSLLDHQMAKSQSEKCGGGIAPKEMYSRTQEFVWRVRSFSFCTYFQHGILTGMVDLNHPWAATYSGPTMRTCVLSGKWGDIKMFFISSIIHSLAFSSHVIPFADWRVLCNKYLFICHSLENIWPISYSIITVSRERIQKNHLPCTKTSFSR